MHGLLAITGDPGPAATSGQLERFTAQLARFDGDIETCLPIRKEDL
jgi:hypothetical protein